MNITVIALLAIGAAILIAAGLYVSRTRGPAPDQKAAPAPRSQTAPDTSLVSLEQQIAALRDAGLPLNPAVTVDDLLHSFPRAEFEGAPYGLLLFMYGVEIEREPSGRYISDYAWNFDHECIEGPGSYVFIVKEFARLTGIENLVTDVTDRVDMNAPAASVSYAVRGARRSFEMNIRNDWVDADGAAAIMHDIAGAVGDGRRFWGADNGQATVLFFISDKTAAKVNALTGDKLEPV